MTLTLVYMALPAYLLVGCILMLIANEILDGAVTRKEFVRGMIVWPLVGVRFLQLLLSALLTRTLG